MSHGLTVKEVIKNNTVTMLYYRHQHIYYSVMVGGYEYSFPVPLEDVQDATLKGTEKAILLMRYIRKAFEEKTFVLVT